jgi:hypothetical protein
MFHPKVAGDGRSDRACDWRGADGRPMVQDFKDVFTDMSHFPGDKTGAIAHMARSLQTDSDAAAKQRPKAFTVHH